MRHTLLVISCSLLLSACASAPPDRSEGWAQIERQDHLGALETFERELESAEDAGLHAGRARALHLAGRLQEAELAYDAAIARDGGEPQWHVGRGIVRMDLGDLGGALADFDRALAIRPGLSKARYDRGLVWLRMEQYAQALADFDQTVRAVPDHAAAFNSRGVALVHLGRLEAAVESFQRAAQLANLAAAHGNCAAAYHALGRLRPALNELNTAIRLERANPVHRANRGRVYMDLGRPDLAVADLEEALALAPDSAAIEELLASALRMDRPSNDGLQAPQAARSAVFTD